MVVNSHMGVFSVSRAHITKRSQNKTDTTQITNITLKPWDRRKSNFFQSNSQRSFEDCQLTSQNSYIAIVLLALLIYYCFIAIGKPH